MEWDLDDAEGATVEKLRCTPPQVCGQGDDRRGVQWGARIKEGCWQESAEASKTIDRCLL